MPKKVFELFPGKRWLNYGLSGVPGREWLDEYETTDVIPPIEPNPEDDLAKVDSPTSCYCDNYNNIKFYDDTLRSFYHDCQERVVWYENDEGKIFYITNDKVGISSLCADSKAEFTTRMRIESDLWFKTRKAFGSSIVRQIFKAMGRPREGDDFMMDSAWLEEHKEKFTEEERAYLQYYIDHA